MVYQAILNDGLVFVRDAPNLTEFVKDLNKYVSGEDSIFNDAVDAMVSVVDIIELYHRFNRLDDYKISEINEIALIWKR